eukprot:SAG11_NODE_75_length_18024_cov_5.885356_11_plen_268_part_00
MTIFSGELNIQCVMSMTVYMVLFACIWEWICGRTEKGIAGNVAHIEMLSKFYKELMILGFISFVVVMSREFGLHMSAEAHHCFEFADMLVTITMLLYIACSVLVSFSMHVTRRNWDRIALSSTEALATEVDRQVAKMQANCCYRFRVLCCLRPKWRDDANFKLMRLIFLQEYHFEKTFGVSASRTAHLLPFAHTRGWLGCAFTDYMTYAKKSLEKNVVELVNITTATWVLIMGMCVCRSSPDLPPTIVAAASPSLYVNATVSAAVPS